MDPALLDVIELRVASGRWPAGTAATLVEMFEDGGLVEISDDDGRTLDIIPLPYEAMTVLPRSEQQQLMV